MHYTKDRVPYILIHPVCILP